MKYCLSCRLTQICNVRKFIYHHYKDIIYNHYLILLHCSLCNSLYDYYCINTIVMNIRTSFYHCHYWIYKKLWWNIQLIEFLTIFVGKVSLSLKTEVIRIYSRITNSYANLRQGKIKNVYLREICFVGNVVYPSGKK